MFGHSMERGRLSSAESYQSATYTYVTSTRAGAPGVSAVEHVPPSRPNY